jgi:glycerophosphoryl diester phosphodiesterase
MDVIHCIEQIIDTCVAYLPRRQPRAVSDRSIQLVAHRGGHDSTLFIQENTLAAFDRALSLGCYGIEFDVQTTADGVLVVNHDPTLTRLWGHDVAINKLHFNELRTLVPAIPSLAEVVALYGKRMHLFVELKAPFVATCALDKALQALIPCVDYHLICLDETVFSALMLFPKECLLLVPTHNNVKKLCKLSLKQQYGGVLGHYLLLNNRQVNALRLANQVVGVGFVNSKFSLYRELNRGIQLLFTNNVAIVASCLSSINSR